MNEKVLREKYQRDDPSDPRGLNKGAIDNFIKMLEIHNKSNDSSISSIANNFDVIENLAPNFIIFESKDNKECFFMHNFKALQIGKDTDSLVSSHEFGHAILSITNDTEIPENYEEIIARAKAHALNNENKENFKSYIEYLAKGGDERTAAEKGPVSDIISSIFQQQGFRINSADNVCILPASHKRSYYFDEEKNSLNLKNIFDEDFANIYALKANNCEKEIESLRSLFGDEFINVLENQLQKSAETIEKANGKEENSQNVSQLKVEEIVFDKDDKNKKQEEHDDTEK